jgi:hypothetical protein
MHRTILIAVFTVSSALLFAQTQQQQASSATRPSSQTTGERQPLNAAPNRRADEGRGPFKTLVIRGAILIDGTGAPPVGPVDIVIENNRIQSVRSAGTPGLPLRSNRPPEKADLEIDAAGMYVMPGFVSLHEHAAVRRKIRTSNIRSSCGSRMGSRRCAACR